MTVAVHFGRGPVRQLIHELKYGGLTELARFLGEMLVSSAQYNELSGSVVIPVPLHLNRLASRGFNQAELLAREVAERLNLSCQLLLARSKDTTSQVYLTREQRLGNVRGAFVAKGDVENKRILLIDDVITTGATLEECARALKQARARQVWALVVARG